jgi:hypothetical protein
MIYLRFNIFQKAGTVVNLEVPIPPELKNALESSPVRHVELLIFDKAQISVPDLSKINQTQINKFNTGSVN